MRSFWVVKIEVLPIREEGEEAKPQISRSGPVDRGRQTEEYEEKQVASEAVKSKTREGGRREGEIFAVTLYPLPPLSTVSLGTADIEMARSHDQLFWQIGNVVCTTILLVSVSPRSSTLCLSSRA